jgi:hypothetical protein
MPVVLARDRVEGAFLPKKTTLQVIMIKSRDFIPDGYVWDRNAVRVPEQAIFLSNSLPMLQGELSASVILSIDTSHSRCSRGRPLAEPYVVTPSST